MERAARERDLRVTLDHRLSPACPLASQCGIHPVTGTSLMCHRMARCRDSGHGNPVQLYQFFQLVAPSRHPGPAVSPRTTGGKNCYLRCVTPV